MSDEVREAINIGLDLIVFAVIIWVCLIFTGYSRQSYAVKQSQDTSTFEIQQYRKLYLLSQGARIRADDVEILGLGDLLYKSDLNNSYIKNARSSGVKLFRDIKNTSIMNVLRTVEVNNVERNIFNFEYNIVTGDDIVRLVGLYPYEYTIRIVKDSGSAYLFSVFPDDFEVRQNNGSFVYNASGRKLGNLLDYTVKDVSNWLGENITSEYYALFIYNVDSGLYESIIFIEKTN